MRFFLGLLVATACRAGSSASAAAPLAAKNGLARQVARLPFTATEAPEHRMEVGVGVFFEHLYKMDQDKHTFKADFWLVYRWRDARNYSALFEYDTIVEVEQGTCSRRDGASEGTRKYQGHDYTGHNSKGHNYIGHNYIGNNCIGHSYIGYNYIGHP